MKKTLSEIVEEYEVTTQCTCDLDRWQPEKSTGHSWVCLIHKLAKEKFRRNNK